MFTCSCISDIMDFDSPDVEKDFPGLYSSEPTRKVNESDYSDDNHDKSFKTDLIAKKKDKKESKKDRGYAALEGESSQDEGDSKSPTKSKKTKSFKFPVKKSEKREKDVKDKDVEKEKKKDKKEKSKSKEKKKKIDGVEVDEHAVFGVPLEKAVERLGCLDGVGIPLPVRQCIDCIHAAGLHSDTLYKTAAVKTKIQVLKKSYNCREPVATSDMDFNQASNLLLTFLRELPEHILTENLVARFEEAAATHDVAQREEQLHGLLQQLPTCNKTLVSWIFVHFDSVTQHEHLNKMNAQSMAMTFSPVLRMSHRLLTALLCHCKSLFADTFIVKYVPPLPPGSNFPDVYLPLSIELKKQEALLSQLHRNLSEGFVGKDREEQLWEVQRIVTQLKRKLKTLKKASEDVVQKCMEEDAVVEKSTAILPDKTDSSTSDVAKEKVLPPEESSSDSPIPVDHIEQISAEEAIEKSEESNINEEEREEPAAFQPCSVFGEPSKLQTEVISNFSSAAAVLKLQLEINELEQWQEKLEERLDHERRLIGKYKEQIEAFSGLSEPSDEVFNESTSSSSETEAKIQELIQANQHLMVKRDMLHRRIIAVRLACMKLNVSINYIELVHNCV